MSALYTKSVNEKVLNSGVSRSTLLTFDINLSHFRAQTSSRNTPKSKTGYDVKPKTTLCENFKKYHTSRVLVRMTRA